MANIRLHPENLDDIRQQLTSAGDGMEGSVQVALGELEGIKERLAGYTNETWGQWLVDFNKRHLRLQDDYKQGVAALDAMKQEIIEADMKGRQYFSV
jgi:hypothetical protein